MNDISTSNFGLLIAYAIPGFIVVWALQGWWPGVSVNAAALPSLLAFLNSTVAAIAAGMAVSAVRFVLVDSFHHATGLRRPAWNGRAVQANLDAINTAVQQFYRHYQFHSNTLVALAVALVLYRLDASVGIGWLDAGWLLLILVFWVGARNNLARYYEYLTSILTPSEILMTNGMHHDVPAPQATNGMHPEKPKPEESKPASDGAKREQTQEGAKPAAATTS
ncbi:MAG: hypothetical protein AAF328_07335 [Planctomycetota bacterium]